MRGYALGKGGDQLWQGIVMRQARVRVYFV